MRRAVTRIAGALVLILSFTASVIAQAPTDTVFVTKTGTKYHKAGCRSLSRSQIPMTLADASRRYGPCSILQAAGPRGGSGVHRSFNRLTTARSPSGEGNGSGPMPSANEEGNPMFPE